MIENAKQNKLKSLVFITLNICLIFISIIPNLIFKGNSYATTVILGTVVVLILILTVMPKPYCVNFGNLRIYRLLKMRYLVLFEILGIMFLINGFIFDTKSYLAIGVTFSFVIPTIHSVLGSNKAIQIEPYISKAIIISFVIIIVISLLCAPSFGKDQYTSIFTNSNIFGYYLVLVGASLFYTIRKKGNSWICVALFISSFCFCFFSNSRTSMIAFILEIVFYFFVSILDKIQNKNYIRAKDLLKYLIAILIIIAIVFSSIFFLFTTVKKEIATTFPAIQIQFEDDNISFGNSMQISKDRFGKGIGNNLDSFTSGRVGIWTDYVKHISVLGHPKEERNIDLGLRVYENTNAHNSYLQVAYSAGIIAGVIMLLLIICLVVDILKTIVLSLVHKSRINDEFCFMVYVCIGFGIISLTAVTYMMYIYAISTYFWILQYNATLK